MEFIPYNSRLIYHKSPFGAVCEETKVTLRIVLPVSFGCTGADLVIESDAGEKNVYPMEWERHEGENEEWWTVSFSAGEQGLYWYRFIIRNSYGESLITKSFGGAGRISPDGGSFQLTVQRNRHGP